VAKRRPFTPVPWKITAPVELDNRAAERLRSRFKKAIGEGIASDFPITGDLMPGAKQIMEGIPRDQSGRLNVNWRGYRRKPFHASLGRNPETYYTMMRKRKED
jgi:hypothetical protein